jgi:hypothetical protein
LDRFAFEIYTSLDRLALKGISAAAAAQAEHAGKPNDSKEKTNPVSRS